MSGTEASPGENFVDVFVAMSTCDPTDDLVEDESTCVSTVYYSDPCSFMESDICIWSPRETACDGDKTDTTCITVDSIADITSKADEDMPSVSYPLILVSIVPDEYCRAVCDECDEFVDHSAGSTRPTPESAHLVSCVSVCK